jgi:hypothetical protein
MFKHKQRIDQALHSTVASYKLDHIAQLENIKNCFGLLHELKCQRIIERDDSYPFYNKNKKTTTFTQKNTIMLP